MLRLPPFEFHRPTTPAEAAELASSLPDAMYMAGGTDLLPNLKHGLHDVQHVIDLSAVSALVGIDTLDDGSLRIGAGTTLHAIATSDALQTAVPGLSHAVSLIAGPQHRRMGTIGGNVMLDTRCLFYNQTAPWRKALGYCLKREGDLCHVIESKTACVAAQSSDSVPMLMALNASIEVIDGDEVRTVSLRSAFKQDGRFDRMLSFSRSALVVAVTIPAPAAGHRSVYRKVRSRGAVDFPQLGIALSAGFDGNTVTSLEAVVSAVMPKPKVLRHMDKAVGTALDDEIITALAEHCFKQTKPQTSMHGEVAWRREMARVEMQRGLIELRDQA